MDPATGVILTNPDGSSVKETKEIVVPAFKVVSVLMAARPMDESFLPWESTN